MVHSVYTCCNVETDHPLTNFNKAHENSMEIVTTSVKFVSASMKKKQNSAFTEIDTNNPLYDIEVGNNKALDTTSLNVKSHAQIDDEMVSAIVTISKHDLGDNEL